MTQPSESAARVWRAIVVAGIVLAPFALVGYGWAIEQPIRKMHEAAGTHDLLLDAVPAMDDITTQPTEVTA